MVTIFTKYTNKPKEGVIFMKKILSVVMSFCTLFFMPIGKVNAMQNQISRSNCYNVAIVCKDPDIWHRFKEYISKYSYDIPTATVTEHDKDCICITRGAIEKNIILNPIICTSTSSPLNREDMDSMRSLLPKCCQVIIIYDISDPTLDLLVDNHAMVSDDRWKQLLNIPTFLNDCLRFCIEDKSIKDTWFQSFNFLKYDSTGELSEEEIKTRRDALNLYTGLLEHRFGIDNKWGRGHATYNNCVPGFLGSLSGTLDRFRRFESEKKKYEDNGTSQIVRTNDELPVLYKIGIGTGVLALIIGTGIAIYKFLFFDDE